MSTASVGSRDLPSDPAAGVSPLFPPAHLTAEAATTAIHEVVHRSPRLCGQSRSRWWLDGLRRTVPWMSELSLGGIQRLLRRLRVHYRRGRRYVHSPDPNYEVKMTAINAALAEARADPQRIVFLYEDELTYYRRPTAAFAYEVVGDDGPRANQGQGSNNKRRIAGCLDAVTGRLIQWQRSRTGRDVLSRFFLEVASRYPQAEAIYLAMDNWPVHFHPDVVAAMEKTKVRLLRLPTYAPWTNPTSWRRWRRPR